MDALVTEGQRFIDSCENSDDNVKMKCADLQNARETLLQNFKAKRGLLLQTNELHQKLQSVRTHTHTNISLPPTLIPLSMCTVFTDTQTYTVH